MPNLAVVFLDESGTHADSNAAVVAGYVSNNTEWEAFTHQWKQALKGAGIEYFHMTDFESSQGLFKGWKEDKKRPLLNDLMQ
ncbi:MAG: hypothetical protein Q7J73_09015 [Dehalococcoidales bacterium]|nr:hypothetical protein [Dehalococcoidales bacterium]